MRLWDKSIDFNVSLSSIRHSQGFSFSNQHLDVNRQQDRFISSSDARCSRQKLIIVGTEASPKRLNDRSKIFKQGSISLSAFDAIVSSTTMDLEVSLLLDKFRTRRFLKLRREAQSSAVLVSSSLFEARFRSTSLSQYLTALINGFIRDAFSAMLIEMLWWRLLSDKTISMLRMGCTPISSHASL